MKFKALVLSLMLCPFVAWGNMGPQGFYEFNNNKVFVETGCYGGDSIKKALDAGFSKVYSMDICEKFVKHCNKRFKKFSNVSVYNKDSSSELWDVIAKIEEPITFWLDAHEGFPDPNAVGVSNTALMGELEQIKQHPIKTHTILIDDLHCCNTLLFDYLSLEDIIAKVLEVNPDYTITFVDGGDLGEYPGNVLVAMVIPEEE